MIYFLVLLFFFLYSFILFFVHNVYVLCFIFMFNLTISLMIHISLKKHFKVLKNNIIFILFIILCNILFSNISSSLKVGIRLFLVIDYTYIMGCYFNPTSIRIAFRYMLYSLRIFRIDVDSLTLIIAVSLAFIPILADEAIMIRLSLRSKGFDFKVGNLMTRPHVYLITFLNSLFDRLDELEKSLIIKAY